MDGTILIPALVGAAGVYLAFAALAFPPNVRLAKTEQTPLRRLQARLDAAELSMAAQEFVLLSLGGGLLITGVALFLHVPALSAAGFVLTPLLLWQRLASQQQAFRRAYAVSLAEIVSLLREGFSATGSLADAFRNATENGPDPAAADFRTVWDRRQLGTELAAAFAVVQARRRNPYLNMVAEALTIKSEQGGNAGKVLLGLETMIREQVAILKEISAKQAQARLEALIISLAPLGFFLLIKVLPWMRDYENGFYSTLPGQIVVAVAVVFSIIAYVLSQRIAGRGLDLEIKEAPGVVLQPAPAAAF
jgi:Flp pilus assembly protein TadB